jgi:hypothetical protein
MSSWAFAKAISSLTEFIIASFRAVCSNETQGQPERRGGNSSPAGVEGPEDDLRKSDITQAGKK